MHSSIFIFHLPFGSWFVVCLVPGWKMQWLAMFYANIFIFKIIFLFFFWLFYKQQLVQLFKNAFATKIFKLYFKQNFEALSKIPHGLRHSFATLLSPGTSSHLFIHLLMPVHCQTARVRTSSFDAAKGSTSFVLYVLFLFLLLPLVSNLKLFAILFLICFLPVSFGPM